MGRFSKICLLVEICFKMGNVLPSFLNKVVSSNTDNADFFPPQSPDHKYILKQDNQRTFYHLSTWWIELQSHTAVGVVHDPIVQYVYGISLWTVKSPPVCSQSCLALSSRLFSSHLPPLEASFNLHVYLALLRAATQILFSVFQVHLNMCPKSIQQKWDDSFYNWKDAGN